jgi:acyl-CoA synthetase (AMP-forming)/AMP-acid ligase II
VEIKSHYFTRWSANPQAPFLRFGYEKWSRLEFVQEVKAAAALLSERGVGRGDRVAVMLETSPAALVAVCAAHLAGAAVVPLNARSAQEEWQFVLSQTRPSLIISESALSPVACPSLVRHELEEQIRQAAIADRQENARLRGVDPNDLAFICFTSGTTGRPKGVMLLHRNVIANLEALRKTWQWTEQDRLLLALPLFHVHGLIVAVLGSIWSGSEIALYPSFEASVVLEALSVQRCTVFMGVPTMYYRLLEAAQNANLDRQKIQARFQGFRLFISGSAPLPSSTHSRFQEVFGHSILERYGMTETLMVLSNPYGGQRKPGSVGFPLQGIEVSLVDDNGYPVPQGEIGEILVRGPNVFAGYWNCGEIDRAILGDGWFRTGDVAYQDDGGYFFVIGRKSTDILKTSGFKISAREIEDALLQLPSVAEAAVVGKPDEEQGEAIVAFIRGSEELSDYLNRSLGPSQAAELLKINLPHFLGARLARYKHPSSYIFLKDLPRNSMGKVSKVRLREMLEK